MKIGIDCRALQELHPSGVSQYTKGLVESVLHFADPKDYEFVLFFSGQALRVPAERKRIVDQLDIPAAARVAWKFRVIPNKLMTVLSFFGFPTLRRLFGDVDVVIQPNLQFTPHSDDIPIVQVVHDFSFVRLSGEQSAKSAVRHWLLRPKMQLQHAAEVVAVSLATFADAQLIYGVSPDVLSVTYPGIPERVQGDKLVDLKKEYDIDPHQPIILAIGTIEPRKNTTALIDAFLHLQQSHPAAQLVLVGKFGYQADEVASIARTQSRVHVLDYSSDAVVQQLYVVATVCVYPSLFEGFGFPPLEAQAHGVPVIAGFHSSLQETLKNSVLWCDVLDSKSMSRAIRSMIDDRALRELYQERGKKNCKRFSWERFAQRILESCERVIRLNG